MTSRVLTLFDPSQTNSGTIQTQTGDPFWQLVIWNESQFALRLVFRDGSTDIAPAFVGSYWRLQDPTDVVQWSIQATIPGNAPLSLCMVILYDPDTRLPANFPVSLSRLTNIGNQVSTTAIPQVINDGNAAPTTVLEASPSGSGTQALINNDGSATLGGGLLKINNVGQITAIPNGALPLAALAAGALPSGVTIPATQLTAGALPSGVTIPYSQVTGAPSGGTATQVDSTNAGSTSVPQVKASSVTGLATKDDGGSSPNVHLLLYPTENDGTARGVELGYVDGSGGLHAGAIQRTNGVFAEQVMDGGTSTLRQVAHYIGTTDPSTYVTVNEGDTWDNA